jgi:hypothetical protein
MARSLAAALSRVNRLASRLQVEARPDPEKMSNEDLYTELVALTVKLRTCRPQDFKCYEQFRRRVFLGVRPSCQRFSAHHGSTT